MTLPQTPTTLEWDEKTQCDFLSSILGHRLLGIERHFHMAIAMQKFVEINGYNITCKEFRDQLNTLFDLEFMELHQFSRLQTLDVCDFSLPSNLIKEFAESNKESDISVKLSEKEENTSIGSSTKENCPSNFTKLTGSIKKTKMNQQKTPKCKQSKKKFVKDSFKMESMEKDLSPNSSKAAKTPRLKPIKVKLKKLKVSVDKTEPVKPLMQNNLLLPANKKSLQIKKPKKIPSNQKSSKAFLKKEFDGMTQQSSSLDVLLVEDSHKTS